MQLHDTSQPARRELQGLGGVVGGGDDVAHVGVGVRPHRGDSRPADDDDGRDSLGWVIGAAARLCAVGHWICAPNLVDMRTNDTVSFFGILSK